MGEALSVEKPPSSAVPPAKKKPAFSSKELKSLNRLLNVLQASASGEQLGEISYQHCIIWKVLCCEIEGGAEPFRKLMKVMTKSSSGTGILERIWTEAERCDTVTVPEEFAQCRTAAIVIRCLIECTMALTVNNSGECDEAVRVCVTGMMGMIKRYISKSLSDPYSDEEVEVVAISFANFSEFCSDQAPQIPKVFETYFVSAAFSDIPNTTFIPFETPSLAQPSGIISSPTEILHLAFYRKALQGRWNRLYTSNSDGFSFNRLVRSFNGYDGPLVFLIKTAVKTGQADVIAIFGDTKFKESNRFYGDSTVFLTKIQPNPRIFEANITSNKNYIWLNETGFGLPHGLGFGGEEKRGVESFRVFIPTSLEKCRASTSCNCFEDGCLLMNDQKYEQLFEIHTIEVWAGLST